MLALEIALRPSWLQGEHFADGALSSAFKPETFEDDVCISKAWEACWELGLTLGHDSMQGTSHLWIQWITLLLIFLSSIPRDSRKMENMKLQSVSFHIGNFCHSYKTPRRRPGAGVQWSWRQEVHWVYWAARHHFITWKMTAKADFSLAMLPLTHPPTHTHTSSSAKYTKKIHHNSTARESGLWVFESQPILLSGTLS